MTVFLQDIRYSLRMLHKNPGFTLVALVTLALGIGANTAMFSVVNSLLLRPLALADPDRIVLIQDIQPGAGATPSSYPEYLDWKERAPTFQQVAAYFSTTFSLTGEGEPEQLPAMRFSSSLLPMLGLKPALGRGFLPEEEAASAPPVAMISEGLWKRRFQARASILGEQIVLAGQPTTVVGVLPPDFTFVGKPDVVIPLRLKTEWASRGLHFMTVLGKLRPGVDLDRARQEAEETAASLRLEGVTKHGIGLVPLQEYLVGPTRPALLALLGAVGLVLLIACANATHLLLARAATRRREIAIRLALGADRLRLLRLLLTEAFVLSLLGGSLGWLLGWWSVDLLVTAGPVLPRSDEIHLDATVLAFTLGISLLTGLLFGLAPALQAAKDDFHAALKEGGGKSGAGASGGRLRSLLVVSEVALCAVLLIGAGLLVRSFVRVVGSEKGFDTSRVLAVDLLLPPSVSDPARQAAFFEQLLERVRVLPGVEVASVVSHLPLGGDNTNSGLNIEGRSATPEEPPLADDRLIGADYFRALHIPVLRGRGFTPQDREGAPRVAIINESLARRFFPGQDPIGRRIDMNWKSSGWQEIVGVVGDVKHDGMDLPVSPTVYVPFLQTPDSGMTLVLRAKGDPLALVGAVRAQVYALDKNQPVSRLRTMEALVSESMGPRRFSMALAGGFAVLALLLAVVGIYGVIAYSVSQRFHEIGIRMALGARRADVLRLVVGQGFRLVLAGLALGLAAAFPLSRVLSRFLFDVSPSDPFTFAGIPLLLAGVALVASYLPARRAARIDPLTALRVE
jgi:putative ABC transport system permease protein